MKYLIVSELSNDSCEMYLLDKADTEVAQNFEEAKEILGKKIAEAFTQRTEDVFDENGRVE